MQWFKQVAGRRGKKIAITALSRKMAGVLYAILGSLFHRQCGSMLILQKLDVIFVVRVLGAINDDRCQVALEWLRPRGG